MEFSYKVLAVVGHEETLVLTAVDRFTACVAAMAQNVSSCLITYIVVDPNNKKMTVASQKKYLSFAQDYKRGGS